MAILNVADKETLDLVYEELKKYNDSKKEYYPSDDLIEMIYSPTISFTNATDPYYVGSFIPQYDGIVKMKYTFQGNSTNASFHIYVMSQGKNSLDYKLADNSSDANGFRYTDDFGYVCDELSALSKGVIYTNDYGIHSLSQASINGVDGFSWDFNPGFKVKTAIDLYEIIPVSKGRPVYFLVKGGTSSVTFNVSNFKICGEVK